MAPTQVLISVSVCDRFRRIESQRVRRQRCGQKFSE